MSLVLDPNTRVAIVSAKFNEFFTDKLQSGAESCLMAHGAQKQNIETIYVSGCFEIPLTLKILAQSKKYDAMIAVGAVIKGDTPHFDYVCQETSKGIAKVSYDYELPIGFGVITTNNIEETIARSGSKAGNKGWEAAMATIDQLNLLKSLR